MNNRFTFKAYSDIECGVAVVRIARGYYAIAIESVNGFDVSGSGYVAEFYGSEREARRHAKARGAWDHAIQDLMSTHGERRVLEGKK